MPFILLLLLAFPAQAQVPVCIPQREGMTACFDGRLCRCRFDMGGALAARPDAHRWDCGPLRPDCRPPEAAHPLPWPDRVPPPSLFLQPPPIPPARKPG